MTRLLPAWGGLWKGSLVIAALFLSASPTFAQAPPDKVKLCEGCHGPAGNSIIPGTPSIAAQPFTFLENSLVYFREGLRNSPVMQAIAKGMKDEDITALAKHFSAQKAKVVAPSAGDKAMADRGRELASKMHCGQCHLPNYQGQNQVPRVAAQREEYMVEAMIGYRDGKRSGADTTMTEVLHGVSDGDIKALAHYLARVE
jgi:cytochrome c553